MSELVLATFPKFQLVKPEESQVAEQIFKERRLPCVHFTHTTAEDLSLV